VYLKESSQKEPHKNKQPAWQIALFTWCTSALYVGEDRDLRDFVTRYQSR